MNQVSSSVRRWFSFARVFILAHILVNAIITVWNLPAAYQNLRNLKPGLGFQGWTGAQLESAVRAAGIVPDVLAAVVFIVGLMCLLTFWGVAAVLAWRKSDTWIGLLIIYILAGTGPGFSFLASNIGGSATGFFAMYQKISGVLIWPTFFVLLYLFPDGQFIPRWTRWLAPLPYLGFFLALWIDPQIIIYPQNIILSLMQWLVLFYAVGGIASQLFRYRRVSLPAQRQQTKWVVYALGILVIGLVITQAILLLDPDLGIGTASRFWFDLFGNYLGGVIMAALIPLSIGISILRYRLWDIDLIIRRTLQYGLLTVLLGSVYFGMVVLLEQAFRTITGQESPLAVVLSTLVIYFLFTPLRRWLQGLIDRRFFRSQYNAERALARYNQTLRDRIDLPSIESDLVRVVTETVQPVQAALWIRPAEKK